MSKLVEVLEKELKSDKVLLLSLEGKHHGSNLEELVRFAAGRYKRTCFVCVNEPYEVVLGSLSAQEVSKLLFIDCITSTIRVERPRDGVVFVSSPHALTEISIAIKKAFSSVDFLIFDSVSTMLIYEDPLRVLRFFHGLISTLKTMKLGSCLIILRKDASEGFVNDLIAFVDKAIEINGGGEENVDSDKE